MADTNVTARVQCGGKGFNETPKPPGAFGDLMVPVYVPSTVDLDISFELTVNPQCFLAIAAWSTGGFNARDRGNVLINLKMISAIDNSELICIPVLAHTLSPCRVDNTDVTRGAFALFGNASQPAGGSFADKILSFGTVRLKALFYGAKPGHYYYIQFNLPYNPAQNSDPWDIWWNPCIIAEVTPDINPKPFIQTFAANIGTIYGSGTFNPEIPLGVNYEFAG